MNSSDPNPRAASSRADVDWMLERTEALCRHDSTTGHEDRALPALRQLLVELDADVELHEVARGRTNVFASWSNEPRLLFTTHLDTVPPFLPPRRDGETLHGRGACDAKGQIACQLAAIRALLAGGTTDVAWLGVVGEETDSAGARAAVKALRDRCRSLRAVIDGEPTENKLATGQRGSLRLLLEAHGIPAHSGMPELGRSALWSLIDWLGRLRELPERTDPDLGREIWNLGLLRGGEAANVIAPHASAELFVRELPDSTFVERARGLAPEDGSLEIISRTEPDRFPRIEGFEHAVVPFGSDAPHVRALVPDRTVVLVGPGSIRLAHTAEERIEGEELAAGRDLLLRLCAAFGVGRTRA